MGKKYSSVHLFKNSENIFVFEFKDGKIQTFENSDKKSAIEYVRKIYTEKYKVDFTIVHYHKIKNHSQKTRDRFKLKK